MAFERAAALTHAIHDLAPGLVSKEGGGFCQWMADNFHSHLTDTSATELKSFMS